MAELSLTPDASSTVPRLAEYVGELLHPSPWEGHRKRDTRGQKDQDGVSVDRCLTNLAMEPPNLFAPEREESNALDPAEVAVVTATVEP